MPARPVTVLVYHADEAEAYAARVTAPRDRVRVVTARTPEEAASAVREAEVVFAWRFPLALLARAPRLRWLQAMGAGVEWALGPELPLGVTVTRVPGVFGPWMTEYVLGWCLWVTQRMELYRAAQRARVWRGDVRPRKLRGSVLCVVGLGDIGRAIVRGARALGLRVVGVNRTGRPVPGAERVWPVGALSQALAGADWVVVVLPLTPETRGLLGARELAAMRPSAWLVNVGRGAVVDEPALLDALRRGRLGGAILDVFATEPLPPGHPFWTLDNVVVTPHIAGPSTPEEIVPVFNDNLRRFLRGQPLRHVVDRRAGY